MLCADCGRSDGLCDCLQSSAPRNPADGVTAPAFAPVAGRPAEAPAGVAIDQRDGLDCTASGPLDGQAGVAGMDGADSLLQFFRDFSSASLRASPVAAAAQLGRNRPVGRVPDDRDPRDPGPLDTAGGVPPAPCASRAGRQATGSPYFPAPLAPATSPAPAEPLRIAPFVCAQSADGRGERGTATSPAATPTARTTVAVPGTTNTPWAGAEFEWARPATSSLVPGAGTAPRSITSEMAALSDGADEATWVDGDESEHVVPRVAVPAEGPRSVETNEPPPSKARSRQRRSGRPKLPIGLASVIFVGALSAGGVVMMGSQKTAGQKDETSTPSTSRISLPAKSDPTLPASGTKQQHP